MGMMVSMVPVGFLCGNLGMAPAAEPQSKAKNPKPSQEPKATKPKAEKPKFNTAETAGKATACFGVAPKIETISPDEGKAGDKVTITETNFGTPTACAASHSVPVAPPPSRWRVRRKSPQRSRAAGIRASRF